MKWTSLTAADTLGGRSAFTIGFPKVDWPALQAVYGWAALQYTVWARGSFELRSSECQSVALSAIPALEFWVDDEHHFGGDVYGFRKAPLVLHLCPGFHSLDLRFARDVRAMGGVIAPLIDVKLDLEVQSECVVSSSDDIVIADIIDGVGLATPWASLTVRNNDRSYIRISRVTSPGVRNQA